jgi:hypothetical protein
MIVSSMMPPCSLRRTERVEENSGSDDNDEGVRYSRNAVADEPDTL